MGAILGARVSSEGASLPPYSSDLPPSPGHEGTISAGGHPQGQGDPDSAATGVNGNVAATSVAARSGHETSHFHHMTTPFERMMCKFDASQGLVHLHVSGAHSLHTNVHESWNQFGHCICSEGIVQSF